MQVKCGSCGFILDSIDFDRISIAISTLFLIVLCVCVEYRHASSNFYDFVQSELDKTTLD